MEASGEKPPRPPALPSKTYEMETACGPIYVTIICDVSGLSLQGLKLRFGKSGGCGAAFAFGVANIISSALMAGMEPSLISKDLGGIICHLGKNTCMNAIAQAICEELGLSEYDEIAPPDQAEEWG